MASTVGLAGRVGVGVGRAVGVTGAAEVREGVADGEAAGVGEAETVGEGVALGSGTVRTLAGASGEHAVSNSPAVATASPVPIRIRPCLMAGN
ncbi:hypothetical protein [Streptomyces sp. NPDC020681]|uniref:hypothetical protein n=1 Tax=Streptomyces sp. NPDC020681 TaxID=3365083 RepID=UPI0037A0196E